MIFCGEEMDVLSLNLQMKNSPIYAILKNSPFPLKDKAEARICCVSILSGSSGAHPLCQHDEVCTDIECMTANCWNLW
ncbi:hypothetical protein PsorP6_006761 [Peronosclerospora sorghi]|uniref:Uncharacterized protein n=1 Tax=Peronosclerospora sorghi TaxID=230839 RepID=A0ACC0W225_9STRA|nr:hypothetical protein PsorP6_006761 [Peronosclerospora sorghi]